MSTRRLAVPLKLAFVLGVPIRLEDFRAWGRVYPPRGPRGRAVRRRLRRWRAAR